MQPLKPYGTDTLNEALRKYIKYLKAKGPKWKQWGLSLDPEKSNLRKKTEIIYSEIVKGTRFSKLYSLYPMCIQNLYPEVDHYCKIGDIFIHCTITVCTVGMP